MRAPARTLIQTACRRRAMAVYETGSRAETAALGERLAKGAAQRLSGAVYRRARRGENSLLRGHRPRAGLHRRGLQPHVRHRERIPRPSALRPFRHVPYLHHGGPSGNGLFSIIWTTARWLPQSGAKTSRRSWRANPLFMWTSQCWTSTAAASPSRGLSFDDLWPGFCGKDRRRCHTAGQPADL